MSCWFDTGRKANAQSAKKKRGGQRFQVKGLMPANGVGIMFILVLALRLSRQELLCNCGFMQFIFSRPQVAAFPQKNFKDNLALLINVRGAWVMKYESTWHLLMEMTCLKEIAK
jgi:hypothetical protein